MADIKTFISTLASNSDISALIEQIAEKKIELPSSAELERHLASLPDEERKSINNSLINVIETLSAYTAEMEAEKKKIEQQIGKNVQNTAACLSYEAHQDHRSKPKT